jgi:ethanolamine utilization protein EutA
VADCIETVHPAGAFGDIGPELGQAIKKSLLCQGQYALGSNTIRATVIGAGCYSTQLSGSTVFYHKVTLPMKNLPVAVFSYEEQMSEDLPELIGRRLTGFDSETVVLAMPGFNGGYGQLTQLAAKLVRGTAGKPLCVCLEADMAKALGQKISLLQPDVPCLCIDRVLLQPESFLDVGAPVGPALPVVVKTLVLQKNRSAI